MKAKLFYYIVKEKKDGLSILFSGKKTTYSLGISESAGKIECHASACLGGINPNLRRYG